MKRLGAIIAGGQSRRFGGDKAAALLNGRALIEHVAGELSTRCDAIIVCGRTWQNWTSVEDHPAPNLGPLGGLCAALRYGAAHGFDVVMTSGCDTLPVPPVEADRLEAVVLEGHYLFGAWPVRFAGELERHLAATTERSMRHWIAQSGARLTPAPTAFFNLNTQADFRHYAQTQGLAA